MSKSRTILCHNVNDRHTVLMKKNPNFADLFTKSFQVGCFSEKRHQKLISQCSEWYDACRGVVVGRVMRARGITLRDGEGSCYFTSFLVSDNSLKGLFQAVNAMNSWCCLMLVQLFFFRTK